MFIQTVTPQTTPSHPSRIQSIIARFTAQPHASTVKDQLLSKRLIDLFEYELAASNLRGIHFYVQDQVVTLQGTVRNAQDHQTLLRLVQNIPNVHYVVDHLSEKKA